MRYVWLLLATVLVGAVVFGLGSRLAMRVVGIAASPEHLGEPTEFGTVGTVTLGGTLGLVIFGGVMGLFTGLGYLAIRRWLPGEWAVRGLLYGLLMLGPVGAFIVASSSSDFDLAAMALIVALFTAMIVGEGLAIAWSVERIGRVALRAPHPGPVGYAVLGTLGALGYMWLGTVVGEML
jgi:hypothetical protein